MGTEAVKLLKGTIEVLKKSSFWLVCCIQNFQKPNDKCMWNRQKSLFSVKSSTQARDEFYDTFSSFWSLKAFIIVASNRTTTHFFFNAFFCISAEKLNVLGMTLRWLNHNKRYILLQTGWNFWSLVIIMSWCVQFKIKTMKIKHLLEKFNILFVDPCVMLPLTEIREL